MPNAPVHTDYEAVAASADAQVLGPVGHAGDVLDRLVATVTAADETSVVTIADGEGDDIPIVPESCPIGVYSIELRARSTGGGWSVTTGAGVSVVAVGRFT